MYISRRSVAAIYKLSLGAIALILEWSLMIQYGWTAFRLFPAWVLLISAVYFLFSALMIALNDRREFSKNYCPMLEGMIMVNLFLMSGVALASAANGFYLPSLPMWLVVFICLILPLVVLADWIVFVKKGRWHVMAPFYWIALPVCYMATMIFTAEITPDMELLYPLEILDYLNFGLFEMAGWALVAILLELIVGYAFFLLDFAVSGKLAKKVVLPHIRTVVVNEDGTTMILDPNKNKPENNKTKASIDSTAREKVAQEPIKSQKYPEIEKVKISKNAKVKTKVKNNQNQAKPKFEQNKTKQRTQ